MAQVDSVGLKVEGVRVVAGVALNLHVGAAECVTVAGPSGSGKTLLLRAIADLDQHSGQVSLDGVDAGDLAPAQWRRRIGLLLAESPWWHQRVGEHFPQAQGLDLRLDALGFAPEVLQWEVVRLSSGERQRLALLRLLALQPAALLLDEPTANLDPENTTLVEQVVAEYRQQHQIPVLWVSHDVAQRRRIADRQLLIAADGMEQVA